MRSTPLRGIPLQLSDSYSVPQSLFTMLQLHTRRKFLRRSPVDKAIARALKVLVAPLMHLHLIALENLKRAGSTSRRIRTTAFPDLVRKSSLSEGPEDLGTDPVTICVSL